jgi:hypothetical protein
MIPRQIDELARQRRAELLSEASGPRQGNPRAARRPSWRRTVGWSMVTIGLRIAALR